MPGPYTRKEARGPRQGRAGWGRRVLRTTANRFDRSLTGPCGAVVLLVVDARALAVLLAVDLRLLLVGEIAAVGAAIVAHFFIDARFLAFELRCFTGRQLA